MNSIIPVWRKEPFDHPDWSFELKYDGFRGVADTVRGRMLSKNCNHLKRYDGLLDDYHPAVSLTARSRSSMAAADPSLTLCCSTGGSRSMSRSMC